jgi:cytochrome o ubiquinol oxidase subunit 3
MSTETLHHEHHHVDPSSKTIFGFWAYIMTDFIMFAALFATYDVLRNNTYGGIGIGQVATLPFVLTQTLILLASTMTCGFSKAASHSGNKNASILWMTVTFILGLIFTSMGFHQLSCLVASGSSWQSSAFLSAYFTLIIGHALHVVIGMLWIIILMLQFMKQDLNSVMKTRITCLTLFWNFISMVWVFIFIIVYLMGAI